VQSTTLIFFWGGVGIGKVIFITILGFDFNFSSNNEEDTQKEKR
jgi:hypothetical protein